MQVSDYSRSIGEWSNERKFNYNLEITGGNNRQDVYLTCKVVGVVSKSPTRVVC